MSIHALLNNKTSHIDIGKDGNVRTVTLSRFTVGMFAQVKESLMAMSDILSSDHDHEIKVLLLITECLEHSMLLIACGADISVEEIAQLDPEDFTKLLSGVILQNTDFFIQAARLKDAKSKQSGKTKT